MSRYYAKLDPSGSYFYTTEPGAPFRLYGRQLLKPFLDETKTQAFASSAFIPPGSDWLMPRPRQFQPNYYRNANFSQSLLDADKWTWGPGIVPVEFDPSKKGGEAGFPANQWIVIDEVPDGTASLDSVSYGALFTTAGMATPAGMKTVGHCNVTPMGDAIGENEYSPFLQFGTFPAPDDVVVFGWQNLALILTATTTHLLRSPNNDKQTWVLLGSWSGGMDRTGWNAPTEHRLTVGLFMTLDPRLTVRSVGAVPVGLRSMYLFFANGPPGVVDLAVPGFTSRPLWSSPWWIGLGVGQKFMGQVQMMTYDVLNLSLTGNPYLFDLGNYRPTVEPSFGLPNNAFAIHSLVPLTTIQTQNRMDLLSPTTSEEIDVKLVDEAGNLWASDGTHARGGLTILLRPSNQGTLPAVGSGYLTPQLRCVEFRFPAKFFARGGVDLILTDQQFQSYRAEASADDPLGGRIYLRVWDQGAGLIRDAGLDQRDEYPVEIWEEPDVGDDILRAAGWILEPELEVFATEGQPRPEGGVLADPIQLYELSGNGLLTQSDQPWLYLPVMVDPSGPGYVEHRDAVAQALRLGGIETTDAARYAEAPDFLAGTVFSRLPGAVPDQGDAIGTKTDVPGDPQWDETRIEYCERIARWKGWRICEELSGKVRYMPDLSVEMLVGAKYYRTATVYKSHADAALAGVPRQCSMGRLRERTLKPEANCIRITGKDWDGKNFPHFIDRDERSLSDDTYENYVGRLKIRPVVSEAAISDLETGFITRVALLRLARRQFIWQVEVWLAPWEFTDPIEVGHVINLPDRGDCEILHIATELLLGDGGTGRGNLHSTVITARKVPESAVRSLVAGGYPGVGA